MKIAGDFELEEAAAREIAAEIGKVVSDWRAETARHGLSMAEIDRMASAFDHEEIRLALTDVQASSSRSITSISAAAAVMLLVMMLLMNMISMRATTMTATSPATDDEHHHRFCTTVTGAAYRCVQSIKASSRWSNSSRSRWSYLHRGNASTSSNTAATEYLRPYEKRSSGGWLATR